MRNLFILLVLSLVAPAVVATTVYRWTDEQGNVVLSDRPPPAGAAGEVRGVESLNVVAPSSATDGAAETEDGDRRYSRFIIAGPANDEVIHADDGAVTVNLHSVPDLAVAEGHRVRLLLDGAVLVESTQMRFRLENLRDTHVLRAELLDASGRVLTVAPESRFHVLRLGSP